MFLGIELEDKVQTKVELGEYCERIEEMSTFLIE